MARYFAFLTWLLLVLTPLTSQETTVLQVAAYPFQPYFSDKGGHPAGILPDLLELLNSSQDRWKFRIKVISPGRRYMELEEGASDLIFFEDRNWDWQDRKVEFSEILLRDSERFLTLWKNGRDEAYFNGAEERPLIAVRGYHYRFAGYVTDENSLRKRFQIALVQNQDLIMEALRLGRGETALVTSSFFSQEVYNNPRLKEEFLVSRRKDQDYDLRIIFSRSTPFSPAEWTELLSRLQNDGRWQAFFRTRGLDSLLP